MVAQQTAHAVTMPLAELLQDDAAAYRDILVSDMALDSRQVGPGTLFLALPGATHDGRQFIEQAVASGCVAVLAEPPVAGFVDAIPVPLVEVPDLRQEVGPLASRFYGEPSRAMHVVGTTGTNGKTTTSRLVAQLVRAGGKSCGVIGTLGATLGDEVGEAANTTPDPVALQRQLAQWRAAQVPAVSMEVSSHALVQGRVNGVAFATAIFTNLSHDHLDYHGSMAAYGRAKLRLFATEGLQHAIINRDDEFAPLVEAAVPPGVERITYSATGGDADVRVVQTVFSAAGVAGTLETPWGSAAFSSPLVGDFNLANVAAAVTAAVVAGADFGATIEAVATLAPVAGRMESVSNALGIQVVVDYAHTPDALTQVLGALRPHVEGALVTVFGCGGDRDRQKRQIMGRVACSLSDRVIVTSDNPRSEDPDQIIADVLAGCSGNYAAQSDRAQAIAEAIAEARPGDCIVLAGKGHEAYQQVGHERRHFSDVAEATSALRAREAS